MAAFCRKRQCSLCGENLGLVYELSVGGSEIKSEEKHKLERLLEGNSFYEVVFSPVHHVS